MDTMENTPDPEPTAASGETGAWRAARGAAPRSPDDDLSPEAAIRRGRDDATAPDEEAEDVERQIRQLVGMVAADGSTSGGIADFLAARFNSILGQLTEARQQRDEARERGDYWHEIAGALQREHDRVARRYRTALEEIADSAEKPGGYTTGEGQESCIWIARRALSDTPAAPGTET